MWGTHGTRSHAQRIASLPSSCPTSLVPRAAYRPPPLFTSSFKPLTAGPPWAHDGALGGLPSPAFPQPPAAADGQSGGGLWASVCSWIGCIVVVVVVGGLVVWCEEGAVLSMFPTGDLTSRLASRSCAPPASLPWTSPPPPFPPPPLPSPPVTIYPSPSLRLDPPPALCAQAHDV